MKARRRRVERTKAVIYARVSPRPEHKRDTATNQVSIEAQLEMARNWVESEGLTLIAEETDEFRSGSDESREGLERAVQAACEEGAVLVVYSQNRLARSFSHLLKIVNRVYEAGASIKTLTGMDMDLDDLDLQLVWKIIALLDEYQRLRIAKDTSDKMRSYQRQGKAMGGKPPYGKRMVVRADGKRVLEDDPEEQDVINTILALHGRGLEYGEIRRELEGAGVTPRGDQWYYATIRSIIERELEVA